MGKKEYKLHSEEWFINEIKKSKGALFFYALKRVDGCIEDAEDLIQTTILKAWKSRTRYQPTFAFSTWLFRILTNALIDFSRQKKQVVIVSMSAKKTLHRGSGSRTVYPFSELRSSRKNMDDILSEELIVQEIETYARKVLTTKKSKIGLMFLYHVDGVPYKEISTIFGKPLGTVKANIFRAKKKIVEKMTGKTNVKKEKKRVRLIKKIKSVPVQGETLKELFLIER